MDSVDVSTEDRLFALMISDPHSPLVVVILLQLNVNSRWGSRGSIGSERHKMFSTAQCPLDSTVTTFLSRTGVIQRMH